MDPMNGVTKSKGVVSDYQALASLNKQMSVGRPF